MTNPCTVEYAARFVDRAGATVADALSLTSVEWTRMLNGASTATVVVNPEGDCCAEMGNIRTWGHAMVIYRNGVFVWSGPVLNIEWGQGDVTVQAVDMSGWLARRVPHSNNTFIDTDLTDIAAWLIADGFAPDDPGHSVSIVAPAGVRGGRSYLTNVGQTLDHLTDLSDTGVDWTVVGTRFVLLPDSWNESVGSLNDGDLPGGMTVAEDGSALTTRWVVAGGSNHDLVGEAGGIDPFYGLLEQYEEQSSVTSAEAAVSAANAKLAVSRNSPVFIDTQDVTISPEAAIDMRTLIPGWSLDMATTATCRNIGQRLKIVGVHVVMQDEGEEVKVSVASGDFGFTDLSGL